MSKQETVSPQQMGVLFFAFMTGSSIINIPSPLIGKAGNGAWLSLLISGGISMGLLGCMLYLHRRYPDLTFVEYSRKLIGAWPTAIMSVLPLSMMMQMLTGIVLDIGLFMRSSMLRETPTYAFTSLIYMVAALSARAGIEVIARMFLLIMILIASFISAVLLLAFENYDICISYSRYAGRNKADTERRFFLIRISLCRMLSVYDAFSIRQKRYRRQIKTCYVSGIIY